MLSRFFCTANGRSFSRRNNKASDRAIQKKRLRLEALEERRMLSVNFTVTTLNDVVDAGDGVLSLREAIPQAEGHFGGGEITFDSTLFQAGPATMTLTNGEMTIDGNVSIAGPGADQLTIDANDQSRIFYMKKDNIILISGVTLTRGYADDMGGAIYNASDLTISDSVITDNFITNYHSGGGIYHGMYGSLTVIRSTLSNNTAAGGGAIYSSSGDLNIIDSTLTGNTTLSNGGAIYNSGDMLIIENSTLSNNTGSGGGAIYSLMDGISLTDCVIENNTGNSHAGSVFINSRGISTITRSTFSGNTAPRSGAIDNSGNLTITDSTFTGNSATKYDGGAIRNSNDLTIVGSTFIANSAGWSGGAIESSGNSTDLVINDSIFKGNTAKNGAALESSGGVTSVINTLITDNRSTEDGAAINSVSGVSLYLINSTIAHNRAFEYGAGIHMDSSGTATLYNSIIAKNNSSLGNDDIHFNREDILGSYNLIGDATGLETTSLILSGIGNLTGTDAAPLDPLFERLGTAGPDGIWGTADDVTGDYRLQLDSLAINSGSNAWTIYSDGSDIEYDLQGLDRIQATTVDRGAYEYTPLYDFGDAPHPSYPTLLANNGARHLAFGPTLGVARDTEADGQPSAAADGDDATGIPDDEDGLLNTPLLMPGVLQTPIDIQVTGTGVLNAWIDFDGNGVWDPTEKIATDAPVVNGMNTILVDVPVNAAPGQTYARFRLTSDIQSGGGLPTGLAVDGEVEDYALTIENGTYLYGTEGDDAVNVWPGTPGGTRHRVQINGANSYFDAAVYDMIYVDGLNGTDTLNVYGKATSENAAFSGTSVHVSESSVYDFHGQGFKNIYVFGGGGTDTSQMLGSTGNDNFYVNHEYSYLRGNSNAYFNYVKNFATVSADVSGDSGTDRTYMYDSPGDDILIAGETQATLDFDSTVSPDVDVTAIGFDQVDTFGQNGGNDTATLTGSSGIDVFNARGEYGYLNGNGGAFYNYVKGFDVITADVSVGGGADTAMLYDSSDDDTLTAGETQAVLDYAATGTPDPNLTAIGFPNVSVYAIFGGDDTATLTGSAGNDRFTGRETYGRMRGDSSAFINFAKGFETLITDVSGTTGIDVATLYDAASDDDLVAGEAEAYFDYAASEAVDKDLIAKGFDQIYSYAIRGGDDSSTMNGSSGADRYTVKPTYSNMKGDGGAYFHYATGFDESFADVTVGGGGGLDQAFLYDTTAGDEFIADAFQATMDFDSSGSPGVDVTAIGFDETYAYSDGAGYDTAILNGSTGADKFYGLSTYSYLKANDDSYYNYVRGFYTVTANAIGAGDLAFLYDSDGNDAFSANATSATFTLSPISTPTVINTVAAFDQVYAYASGTGTDKAYLDGTTGADTLTADADWGILRSTGTSDYFNYVRYFDEVFADPGDTDVGNDTLDDRGATYALDTTPAGGNVW
jgi:predicted outer membrane repeat protein